MRFKVENEEKHALVSSLIEKLDSLSAPDLKTELVYLNKSGVKNIIVDLSSCRYCDSSGLSALLTGNRLTKEIKGTFIICGLQASVAKLVQISMLDKVFTITPTRAEAMDIIVVDNIERELDGGQN